MLHAAMGTPLLGKRRSIHSREFRKRERAFTEYEQAAAWRKNEAANPATDRRTDVAQGTLYLKQK
jgi:hypothetical protein